MLVSIIIFSSDSGFYFIDASEAQPSVFAENSSVVCLTHSLHDVFLSASLQGGDVVVLAVTEVSLVVSGSSE